MNIDEIVSNADPFTIKAALSFVVGSIWITALSLFSERLGSKIGGAIAGIPATMVMSLAFIGITQSAQAAAATTTVIPLMLGVNIIMVSVFLTLMSRLGSGFWLSLSASLCCWLLLSCLVVTYNPTLLVSLFVYLLVVVVGYIVVEHTLSIVSVPGGRVTSTKAQILFRGLIAGATVCGAVLAARYSGPTLGGVFATFPALTVALMLIFKMSGSEKLLPAFLKNFIVVGTINVCVFVLTVRYMFPVIGVGWGTVCSLTISLLTSYVLYLLVNKNMK